VTAAQGLALPTASEDDAADMIATGALCGVPIYRLQPPGPLFLACVGTGTRELRDLTELRQFVRRIRGDA
jgi:hypothetical protein